MTEAIFSAVGSGIVLAAAQTSLPTPVAGGVWAMVQNWTSLVTQRTVPEFDLVMFSDDTDNVTVAKLWAGIPMPFTITADATVSIAHPVITDTAHGFFTGDGPVRLTTSGTIPVGLALATDYWIIKIDADTYKLASSFVNAMASTPVPVAFTGDGTGTLTVTGTAACQRVHWCEVLDNTGHQIGRANDGAVALTNQNGWRQRFPHSPMVVAYALSATLSANHCSATIFPIGGR